MKCYSYGMGSANIPIFLWRETLWRQNGRFAPSSRMVNTYFAEPHFNQWTGEMYDAGWRRVKRTAMPITNIFTGETKIAYTDELIQYADAPMYVKGQVKEEELVLEEDEDDDDGT